MTTTMYTVTLHPIGVQIEVHPGETVLNAALRQSVSLTHGCRAGNCASCKSILLTGDVTREAHSLFALEEDEISQGYILLCRTRPQSDLVIQLISYDEALLQAGIVVETYQTTVAAIEPLTHDIKRLVLAFSEPGRRMPFFAGQYASIRIPGSGESRTFSMANTPHNNDFLEFIIKIIPGGRFSSLLAGEVSIGHPLEVSGPYGIFRLREQSSGHIICVGGGSGMAPLWSLLNDIAERGIRRAVTFYYGARQHRDLFYLDQLEQLAQRLPGFRFIPALSMATPEDEWDGEIGLITDVLNRTLANEQAGTQAYLCGPPPMIDAALPVLVRKGISQERIFYEKFTPTQ